MKVAGHQNTQTGKRKNELDPAWRKQFRLRQHRPFNPDFLFEGDGTRRHLLNSREQPGFPRTSTRQQYRAPWSENPTCHPPTPMVHNSGYDESPEPFSSPCVLRQQRRDHARKLAQEKEALAELYEYPPLQKCLSIDKVQRSLSHNPSDTLIDLYETTELKRSHSPSDMLPGSRGLSPAFPEPAQSADNMEHERPNITIKSEHSPHTSKLSSIPDVLKDPRPPYHPEPPSTLNQGRPVLPERSESLQHSPLKALESSSLPCPETSRSPRFTLPLSLMSGWLRFPWTAFRFPGLLPVRPAYPFPVQ